MEERIISLGKEFDIENIKINDLFNPDKATCIKYTINGEQYHGTIHKENITNDTPDIHVNADSGVINKKEIRAGTWNGKYIFNDSDNTIYNEELTKGLNFMLAINTLRGGSKRRTKRTKRRTKRRTNTKKK